jgi:hypothetical protein
MNRFLICVIPALIGLAAYSVVWRFCGHTYATATLCFTNAAVWGLLRYLFPQSEKQK